MHTEETADMSRCARNSHLIEKVEYLGSSVYTVGPLVLWADVGDGSQVWHCLLGPGVGMVWRNCRPAFKFLFPSLVAWSLTVTWEVLLPSVGHMLRFFPSFIQLAFIEYLVSAGGMSVEQRQKHERFAIK